MKKLVAVNQSDTPKSHVQEQIDWVFLTKIQGTSKNPFPGIKSVVRTYDEERVGGPTSYDTDPRVGYTMDLSGLTAVKPHPVSVVQVHPATQRTFWGLFI